MHVLTFSSFTARSVGWYFYNYNQKSVRKSVCKVTSLWWGLFGKQLLQTFYKNPNRNPCFWHSDNDIFKNTETVCIQNYSGYKQNTIAKDLSVLLHKHCGRATLGLRRPFCWHSSEVKRWLSGCGVPLWEIGLPQTLPADLPAKWIWISRLGAHIECHKRSLRSPSRGGMHSLTMWSFHQTTFCTKEKW